MILCCVLAVFIIVLKGAPIVHRERVLLVGKPSIATVIDLHTTVGGRGRVTDGFFIDFIYPEMPLKGHVSSPVEEIGFEGIQRGQKLYHLITFLVFITMQRWMMILVTVGIWSSQGSCSPFFFR